MIKAWKRLRNLLENTERATVRFDHLPASTQKKFIEAVAPENLRHLVLYRRLSSLHKGRAGKRFLLAVVLLLVPASFGFGNPENLYQFAGFGLWYVLAFALGLYEPLKALHYRWLKGRLPYCPGLYVFPKEVVVANGNRLEFVSLDELDTVVSKRHRLFGAVDVLKFNCGREISFSPHHSLKDARLAARIQNNRRDLQNALLAGDGKRIRSLDTFAELRNSYSSPFAGDRPNRATAICVELFPAISRFRASQRPLLLGIFIALPLGVCFLVERNELSDEAAFRRLDEGKGSISQALAYSASQGRKTDFVQEAIIPRYHLAEAQQAGIVWGYRQVIAQFPASKEAEVARESIRKILEQKMYGTFFPRGTEFPHPMHAALVWLAKHNERSVLLSVQGPSPVEIEQARKQVNDLHDGVTFVDKEFWPRDALNRRDSLYSDLSQTFQEFLDTDELELELDFEARAWVSSVEIPLVHISYHIPPIGYVFKSEHQELKIAGLAIAYYATIEVPGQEKKVILRHLWRPKLEGPYRLAEDTLSLDANVVYRRMADDAFEEFRAELWRQLFGSEFGKPVRSPGSRERLLVRYGARFGP